MHSFHLNGGPDPKDTTYRDKEYLKFIRSRPCCVCARKAIAHHEPITGRGTGIKCPDTETLPLCDNCHEARHRLGKTTFWKQHFMNARTYITQDTINFLLARMMIKYLTEFLEKISG